MNLHSLRHFAGSIYDAPITSFQKITADGSQRLFYRITFADLHTMVAIIPADQSRTALAEALSSFTIGRHLAAQGVPVPQMYAHDSRSGVVLCEDGGDTLLAAWVADHRRRPEAIKKMYRRILSILASMQVKGINGWQDSFAYDTQRYDRSIMIKRESLYFSRAFAGDFLNIAVPQAVNDEFIYLAEQCLAEDACFFLHRDFQSRNILIGQQHEPLVIDFQAGRRGPPGYDLASLLRDPYVGLSEELQKEFVAYYLEVMSLTTQNFDEKNFLRGYFFLALQRNMQILGAFAYLSMVRKKKRFLQYIEPAVCSLVVLMNDPAAQRFPHLQKLVEKIYHATAMSSHRPGWATECR